MNMARPRRFVTEDFKGALGAFTPCFIDIVVLGAYGGLAYVC